MPESTDKPSGRRSKPSPASPAEQEEDKLPGVPGHLQMAVRQLIGGEQAGAGRKDRKEE